MCVFGLSSSETGTRRRPAQKLAPQLALNLDVRLWPLLQVRGDGGQRRDVGVVGDDERVGGQVALHARLERRKGEGRRAEG